MVLTAKTINEIIQQVYSQDDLLQCCAFYTQNFDNSLKFDLWHEIIIQLYALPKQRLMNMYKDGWLKFYIISAIKNSIISNNDKTISGFKRKYGFKQIDKLRYIQTVEQEDDLQETNKKIYEKARTLALIDEEDKKMKYNLGEIFKLYYDDKLSGRQIAKKTNISPSTVFKYIRIINNKIKKHNYDNDN